MGFELEEVKETSFGSLKDLREFTIVEMANTAFIPIKDFIENGASFAEDKFFGYKKKWLTFNDDSFQEFCKKSRIPFDFIQRLNEGELVSKILNNYINVDEIKDELLRNQFVIDKAANTIIGIVSNTYTNYSNKEFLEDVEEAYADLFMKFEITESFIINTKLYLRLLSPRIISGYSKGDYYEGEDISQIGVQLKNSMIGNSSVKIDYYIYRALCSNGLVVETFNESNRILHSGKRENFVKRLDDKIMPIIKDISKLPKMLKDLVELEYNPYTLAKLKFGEHIYKIIPLTKYEFEQRKKLKDNELVKWDYGMIERYVHKYSGELSGKVFNSYHRNNQSMFDFINIFTEYAHLPSNSKKERIYIEEKTGELVSWIIRNKSLIKKENCLSHTGQQVNIFDFV